ncbi:hypothetical protein BS47DRAFT_1398668 [Hydnum rufescens UP504]|uniref:Uncharacterized protein n=1 Tax=Hydnum rufescens UP504 TaxID=1448309 RepID=A0A9P6DMY1_9AGAM|nr:hypothetical protein BS47DRAFT_1398668 [Hydnum rufescens UP504]
MTNCRLAADWSPVRAATLPVFALTLNRRHAFSSSDTECPQYLRGDSFGRDNDEIDPPGSSIKPGDGSECIPPYGWQRSVKALKMGNGVPLPEPDDPSSVATLDTLRGLAREEIVMKKDGATKTSEDKARVIMGDRGTTKINTPGNPSGLQFLWSRVTSESGSIHLLLGGKPGRTAKEVGAEGESPLLSTKPVSPNSEFYTTSNLIHSVLDVGKNMRRPSVKSSNNAAVAVRPSTMAKTASLRRTGSRRIKGAHSAPTSTVFSSRNASGYQKRLERKNKRPPTNDPDVYEYSATRDRRANITLDIDKDELRGLGQDTLDGHAANKDMEMLRQKITAAMGEDMGVVGSEDDEDIDSDAAFEGDSDEERFSAFKFAQKPGPSKRPKPPKKSTGRSLSALLDGDGGESANNDDGASGADSRSDEGSSDAEEDEEEVLAPSDDEDIEVEGDALNKLDSFIDDLSHRKRKASDITDPFPARSIKRRFLNGWKLRSKGNLLFQAAHMLPSSASGNNASLASLEKSAKLLSSTNNQPLSAPLHQRQQDRVDREAAYEATKEEVHKWAPTMKRIKEAEHLSFPLQAPAVLNTSSSELTSKLKPSTELESAVDWLLKASKLREEDIEKTEELQMSNLTIKEVTARRAELRQMRELMFRAEAKAKRISKIKSKTFQKIQKKAREKNALTLDQIGALDPEVADAERLKLETARAKERATLRHKNTSRWAKQMNARGLERGEQLHRKIQGLNEEYKAPEDFVESDGENDIACKDEERASGNEVHARRKNEDTVPPRVWQMIFGQTVQGNQGRLIFRPTADQSRMRVHQELRLRISHCIASIRPSTSSQPSQHIPPSDRESSAGEPATSAKEKNEILVSKKSSLASKSKVALKKQLARTEDALSHEADDAVVEISLDKAMTINHAKQKPKQKSKQEGKETMEVREIEADAPTTVDMTLPGWGSWGGRGTKKSQPKPHLIKKVPGVAPAARADAGKARVIISERKDKKAGRYMVKDLPHSYTTKARFESSLEMPIGPEWNTRMGPRKHSAQGHQKVSRFFPRFSASINGDWSVRRVTRVVRSKVVTMASPKATTSTAGPKGRVSTLKGTMRTNAVQSVTTVQNHRKSALKKYGSTVRVRAETSITRQYLRQLKIDDSTTLMHQTTRSPLNKATVMSEFRISSFFASSGSEEWASKQCSMTLWEASDWDKFKVKGASVPVIIEIKRAASRRLTAQKEAVQQGEQFFLDNEYRTQKSVILIVTSGEWCCWLRLRGSEGRRNPSEHDDLVVTPSDLSGEAEEDSEAGDEEHEENEERETGAEDEPNTVGESDEEDKSDAQDPSRNSRDRDSDGGSPDVLLLKRGVERNKNLKKQESSHDQASPLQIPQFKGLCSTSSQGRPSDVQLDDPPWIQVCTRIRWRRPMSKFPYPVAVTLDTEMLRCMEKSIGIVFIQSLLQSLYEIEKKITVPLLGRRTANPILAQNKGGRETTGIIRVSEKLP